MRRFEGSTPRLDLLRRQLRVFLRRRGAASALARACSICRPTTRQQISLWFTKGSYIPPATPTLLAARFIVSQPKWKGEKSYIPTWDELMEIVTPLLTIRGTAADLSRHCGRPMYAVSRYFAHAAGQRREPDGEVALAALDWLTLMRQEHSMIKDKQLPEPSLRIQRAVRKAFAVEHQLKCRTERTENEMLSFLQLSFGRPERSWPLFSTPKPPRTRR
jgi:hypothetical protein